MATDNQHLEDMYHLSRHPGYEYLRTWINREITSRTDALLDKDLADVAAASSLQGEIRGLRSILRHVDYQVKQYHKQFNEEAT